MPEWCVEEDVRGPNGCRVSEAILAMERQNQSRGSGVPDIMVKISFSNFTLTPVRFLLVSSEGSCAERSLQKKLFIVYAANLFRPFQEAFVSVFSSRLSAVVA